ncbi:MAG TPA: hypothetical protein VFF13_04250 [archaeon]|nr:hypothetical protein [archaeon]
MLKQIRYADIFPKQKFVLTKNISQKDLENFALFLADNSKDVRAKNVLAQGTYPNYLLLASIISEILGNTLPGPGYVSLGFMFETKSNNLMNAGENITTEVVVAEKFGGKFLKLHSKSFGGKNEFLLYGEILVMAPDYLL